MVCLSGKDYYKPLKHFMLILRGSGGFNWIVNQEIIMITKKMASHLLYEPCIAIYPYISPAVPVISKGGLAVVYICHDSMRTTEA